MDPLDGRERTRPCLEQTHARRSAHGLAHKLARLKLAQLDSTSLEHPRQKRPRVDLHPPAAPMCHRPTSHEHGCRCGGGWDGEQACCQAIIARHLVGIRPLWQWRRRPLWQW